MGKKKALSLKILCKQMKDDDLKTPRTSKDKKVIGQGQ